MDDDEIFDVGAFSLVSRRACVVGGLALSLGALLSGCGGKAGNRGTAAQGIGTGLGLTKLSELHPFQFSDVTGTKPDLPKRLSLANVNTAEIYTLLSQGMKAASDDRGIAYAEANAQTNVAKNVSQIQSFLQRGTGGLLLIPLGPHAQDVVSKQALQAGTVVFGLSVAPSSSQVIADQYAVGRAHGDSAVAWIKDNLGGKANVAYFNLDAIAPVLVARHKAVLDALRAAGPGIKVIDRGVGQADFSSEGGFKLTSSLLQAEPDVDVIMGADTFILGAARAVKAAGNNRVKYIAGVDGEALVLDQIKEGGLIKATHGFAWRMLGYAIGQFAADWMEGKTIPQAIVVEPVLLDSAKAIDAFQARNADPAQHWKTDYLTFRGEISYEHRDRWLLNSLVGDSGR
jgi:ribose transport system substrate-binding protein